MLLCSKEATLDAAIVLGIRQGQSYKLLGQPMGVSEGILDTRPMSINKRGQVTKKSGSLGTTKRQSWSNMKLMYAR